MKHCGVRLRRSGSVQRAILLHLLTASLRPTLQGMHTLISEGSSCTPQSHLCLRSNLRDVPATSPQFWSESITVSRDTARKTPENDDSSSGGNTNCNSAAEVGRSHVPWCLKDFVEPVTSAAKSVALLREYDRNSRAALLGADGSPAATPVFPRQATSLPTSLQCFSFRLFGHICASTPICRFFWISHVAPPFIHEDIEKSRAINPILHECRLLEVLTDRLQHVDSSDSTEVQEPDQESPGKVGLPFHGSQTPAAGHHCTHLMHHAAELLSDMHRCAPQAKLLFSLCSYIYP